MVISFDYRFRLEQERLRVEMERKRELEGIEREKAEMRRLTELNRYNSSYPFCNLGNLGITMECFHKMYIYLNPCDFNRLEIEQRQRALKRAYVSDDYSSTDRHRSSGRSSNRDGYEAKRAMIVSSDRDRSDSKRDRDDNRRYFLFCLFFF